MYILNNGAFYFDSFVVEHLPKEIRDFSQNKNMQTNIFRIQANDSIMCRYFWIGFIDYMLADKTLIGYTSLFLAHDFKKNDRTILNYIKKQYAIYFC